MEVPFRKIEKIYEWIFKDGNFCLPSMKISACNPCLKDALRKAYELGWLDRTKKYKEEEYVDLPEKDKPL